MNIYGDEVFEPGTKVKHKETSEIFTIKEYLEDSCGDGCCQGYLVEENRLCYWLDTFETFLQKEEEDYE